MHPNEESSEFSSFMVIVGEADAYFITVFDVRKDSKSDLNISDSHSEIKRYISDKSFISVARG